MRVKVSQLVQDEGSSYKAVQTPSDLSLLEGSESDGCKREPFEYSGLVGILTDREHDSDVWADSSKQ